MGNTKVRLYTRNRCHLCENAKEILLELREAYPFDYEEFDIDDSDTLTEQYGLMIPVVEIDGEEVQYGIIDRLFIIETLTKNNGSL